MMIGEQDYEEDEVRISLDELENLIEERICLDDLKTLGSVREAEDLYTEENILQQELLDLMDDSLLNHNFEKAFAYAKKLKAIDYSRYRNQIYSCIKACADEGILGALIEITKPVLSEVRGKMSPEMFQYLVYLSKAGYINSFYRLGNCYLFGEGCVADKQKAIDLFFDAYLFCNVFQCKRLLRDCYWELSKYKESELWAGLIRDLFENRNEDAKCRMAELMFEGSISGYSEKATYLMLRKYNSIDGYGNFLLAKCLLQGIGTEVNYVVAKKLLMEANSSMDSFEVLTNPDEKMLRSYYHETIDFCEVHNEILELLHYLENKIGETNEVYSESWDEDDIFIECRDEEILFIK